MSSIERVELFGENFVLEAARWLTEMIVECIASRGCCTLGLSGGSTPFPVYAELGRALDIEWSKVYLFMVDERYVPVDSDSSNQGQVRRTLLQVAAVPESNLIFPNVSFPFRRCVEDYDVRMGEVVRARGIDIVVLGLGEDGHFASLFPNMKSEDLRRASDPRLFAMDAFTEAFEVRERITTTYAVLKRARTAMFLIAGEGKVRVWEEMESSLQGIERWPAKPVLEEVNTFVFVKK